VSIALSFACLVAVAAEGISLLFIGAGERWHGPGG
jgi:hypothetical protein